jgi:hypothetical protein
MRLDSNDVENIISHPGKAFSCSWGISFALRVFQTLPEQFG